MNLIKPNISACANTFVELNSIIAHNYNNLKFNLSKNIINDTNNLFIKVFYETSHTMGLQGVINNNNIVTQNITSKD